MTFHPIRTSHRPLPMACRHRVDPFAVVVTKTMPSLSNAANNNSQFLPASAPSECTTVLATPLLGHTNNLTQVFVVADQEHGPIDTGDQAAIAREIAAADKVRHVYSITDLGTSLDGKAAQVLINAYRRVRHRAPKDAHRPAPFDLCRRPCAVGAAAPPGRPGVAVALTIAADRTSRRKPGARHRRGACDRYPHGHLPRSNPPRRLHRRAPP